MKHNQHNISLSHSNIHLDLNNQNDAHNIDLILTKVVENRFTQNKVREILMETSMKYLKRLNEDGFVIDNTGTDLIVYEPIVTEKAIEFIKAGGYSKLYRINATTQKSWLSKWWWSILVPLLIGIILLSMEYKWFK
ncbi:MAG: hypothetical protein IPJ06_20960 [Saprospiraceae bacterium]|nr:hypothetical protein [Saprospiraceae bacterium]